MKITVRYRTLPSQTQKLICKSLATTSNLSEEENLRFVSPYPNLQISKFTGVLEKTYLEKLHKIHLQLDSLLIMLQAVCNFIKRKRLNYFPVNFAKYFKTAFFLREHLQVSASQLECRNNILSEKISKFVAAKSYFG